jgi:hypothetical protein
VTRIKIKVKKNNQVVLQGLRSQEERKLRALYTLLCLIFLAIVSLLGLHALIVGPGSLFWDLAIVFFSVFSVAVLASGVIFPILALCAVLALPFVFLAIYLRNR